MRVRKRAKRTVPGLSVLNLLFCHWSIRCLDLHASLKLAVVTDCCHIHFCLFCLLKCRPFFNSIKYQSLNDNNSEEFQASFVLKLCKPLPAAVEVVQRIYEVVGKTGEERSRYM